MIAKGEPNSNAPTAELAVEAAIRLDSLQAIVAEAPDTASAEIREKRKDLADWRVKRETASCPSRGT